MTFEIKQKSFLIKTQLLCLQNFVKWAVVKINHFFFLLQEAKIQSYLLMLNYNIRTIITVRKAKRKNVKKLTWRRPRVKTSWIRIQEVTIKQNYQNRLKYHIRIGFFLRFFTSRILILNADPDPIQLYGYWFYWRKSFNKSHLLLHRVNFQT